MNANSTVQFGVIGCGGIANGFHLRDLQQIDGVRVVALADVREEAARRTAENFKDRWPDPWITTAPEELLGRDDVDAVIVATHHETHAGYGAAAIEAGKHVLVQKPLTTDMAHADRFVETADAHPDILVQCLPYNWNNAVRKSVELMGEGAIGKPVQARMRVAHPGPSRDSWFYDPEIAKFGASMDMGVYAVSGITTLMGSAASASGLVGTFEEGVRIDDAATWLLKFHSGAFGTAETSWTSFASTEGTSIWGTEGVIALNAPDGNRLKVYRRTSGVSFGSKGEWSTPELEPEPTAAPHRHFVECIRAGVQPLGTPRHARHVVEVMLAAHESSRTGNRIDLHTTF
ncbi:MAG: Gfo/Idh/MocA family oxidoreductase [Armatimonadetes bacterium]|nr:Gfo/Idh/MocA family oxidoreductase [Armatimonadota bacterium]